MDVDSVAAEVAAAVGLAEGPAGVVDVLRVIARHEPVPAREVARRAELPVPIVAAICNELRKRDVVARERPVRLTPGGRASVAPIAGLPEVGGGQPEADGLCPCCAGHGITMPERFASLVPALERVAAGMPPAKLELDQTHCTVDTKLRRVLRMHEAGALGGQRVVVLGDDDLVSVAIAAVAARAGPGTRPRQLAVVDCDHDLLSYLAGQLAAFGMTAELTEHDLRDPLPAGLLGRFDVACTDPPYTLAGAELFVSRAVSALRPGGGAHVFFSFGARRPGEQVATQRLLASMGLAVRSLVPGFNDYTGAGILAGTSSLYHLRTTVGARPSVTGAYAGALYSAQSRAAATRPYLCAGCGAVHQVGPGARWAAIADLKAAGCPGCGGTVLRPRPLSATVPASVPASRQVRQPRHQATGGAAGRP